MKKLFIFILFLGVLTQLNASQKNLVLHYDFSPACVSNKTVLDNSGSGYHATLANNAFVDSVGKVSFLNLGFSDGYLDMGEKAGNIFANLSSFSISAYVFIDEAAHLRSNGNFIWTFANSDDMMRHGNGSMFFSARTSGYIISPTNYSQESNVQSGSRMPQNVWKHVVYVQSGNNGSVFIDGQLVKTNNVPLLPAALGKTRFNFLGRSPYRADVNLKGLIGDFRIYNKALSANEIKSIAGEFSQYETAITEYRKRPVKLVSTANPVFTHKYTADPAALVHNDVLYVYTGQDTGDGRGYNMPNWLVFSTEDMETWYEHPVPLRVTDFKWAKDNSAWASEVVERNGKFYWYVSTEHASVHGKAIGVAVSDTPTGPFVDARGSALVTNDMTTKWTNISWDDIDPTVFIDDDGQAYMFWGNVQCYYVKLKDNMIELDGEIMPVDLPHFTEAPWIHKRGDWYYLSYAAWFPEKTVYAMSKSIHGPWEYKGILNEVAGNSNTNHQAIVEFKGEWFFVYHNGSIPTAGGSYLRSVCIDRLYYNEDNTLKRVIMTSEGVGKLK